MAYTTIEKNGEPWMFCHSVDSNRLQQEVAEARTKEPNATFTHRMSTPVESQHCADAMDAQDGITEDPFKFFSTPAITDPAD